MIRPVEIRTGAALLSAAVLVAGCCGPDRGRTAMHFDSSPRTVYTDASRAETAQTRTELTDTTTTTMPAAAVTTTEERTQVRGAGDNEREWALPLYAEELRVGKREVENGSVRLRKTVRTESASQPIELRRETVVIDREAFERAREAADAGRPNEFGAAFEEKEIVIDLKREEPVVEVQQYMSGRIVAEKRVTTDRENVTRQVRREDVEVVKSGNDRDITVSERVRADQAIGAPGRAQERETGTSEREIKVREDNTDVDVDVDVDVDRDRSTIQPGTDNQDRIPAKGGSADLQPNKLHTDKTR